MPTTSNIYGLTDTWNDGATTFVAIQMDVTDTASAAASKLIDLQKGSVSQFNVDKDGNLTLAGTVDGRDVATDGTKLDGIEAGAKDDQTGAEIKALYEAEANAFTDAQFTKLSGISSNADVTADAGAVMETDTTTAAMQFVVDEDDMVSDSDTKVPTQQSVKAYVDGKVGVIEQKSRTAAYTLLDTDAGKHISTNSAITVDGGVHALGDAITIYNNSNASITITQGTNCSLRLAGTATTGNLTLAQYGVATILCVTDSATDVFVVSGGGLS